MINKTKIKQKIKEFKRKSLKNLQAKLRKFLQTEYRTSEEIQKDRMDAHLKSLKEIGPEYSLDYMSGYVGEITFTQDKAGKTYYRNHITGKWINVNDDEEISDDELNIRLGLQTEIDQKLKKKLEEGTA